MGESKFSFFVADIILLIVFLGLTRVIFRYSGLIFLLELLFAVILLLIAFIAIIPAYSGSRGGWGFLSGVFILILFDFMFIYFRTQKTDVIFLGTSFFAALGFLVSVMNIKKEEKEAEEPVEEEKD